jgi:hypothetical protein
VFAALTLHPQKAVFEAAGLEERGVVALHHLVEQSALWLMALK